MATGITTYTGISRGNGGSLYAGISDYTGITEIAGTALPPDLMSGADGALVINGGGVDISAGEIKRYSSISITNSGRLYIRGAAYYFFSNDGTIPTLIGCSGNCTINTGGKIIATDNAANTENGNYGGSTFTAPTVPFDAVVTPIEYTTSYSYGGGGGSSYSSGGVDNSYGCGGGGAGLDDGNSSYGAFWGTAGSGGNGTAAGGGGIGFAPYDGFGLMGTDGLGGETVTGLSVGGGAGGGARGASGSMVYIQVGGTISVSGVVIDTSGGNGGAGGAGGLGSSPDDDSYGGGGGGGGAGGHGGNVTIRYKSGSITSSNVTVLGGIGALGGQGGSGLGGFGGFDGVAGTNGDNGVTGTIDIASY
jgi:hypothetical protein